MERKIKVLFNNETKEVVLPSTLVELKQSIKNSYKNSLPVDCKLYYTDEDEDLLLITNQNDYEIALSSIREDTLLILKVPEIKMQDSFGDFEIIKNKDKEKPSKFSLNTQDVSEYIKPSEIKETSLFQSICSCLHCKGTKVNKKGDSCKRCHGTGKMSKELTERIKLIVKNEVAKIIKTEVPLFASKMIQSQYFIGGLQEMGLVSFNAIHYGVVCRKCGLKPIIGIRYSCIECKDFDLCEICEKSTDHEHPMCKMRRPKQAVPGKYKDIEVEPEPEKLYDVRIIEENMKGIDRVLEPRVNCSKKWVLKNTGKLPWPKETAINVYNSFEPKYFTQEVGAIEPGCVTKVVFPFTAPIKAGSYFSYCQLSAGDGLKLGDQISLEIEVKLPIQLSEKTIKKDMRNKLETIPRKYMTNLVKLKRIFNGVDYDVLFTILKETDNDIEKATDILNIN